MLQRATGGFTAIELIVSIGIFSLIMVTMMAFVARGYQSFFELNDRTSSIRIARTAAERLSRELREARAGGNGAYALSQTATNSISFYANVDGDTDIERVRYELSGTDLLRGIINPVGSPPVYNAATESVTVESRFVRNGAVPVFSYYPATYQGAGAPLAQPVNPNAVRYVAFSLTVDEEPGRRPEPIVVASSVMLRNLKDNL